MKYLITCNQTRARHDYIRNHLNGIFGHNWNVVFAPDWRLLTGDSDTDSSKRHASLTLAYYQTLQTALFSSRGDVMIMEDDISFLPEGVAMIEGMINELPEDYDLCYLTRTAPANDGAITNPYSDNLENVVSNWWETPLTLWSRKFAREFCRYIDWKLSQGSLGNIDHELNKLNEGASEWPSAKSYIFLGAKNMTAYGLSTTDNKFDSSLS